MDIDPVMQLEVFVSVLLWLCGAVVAVAGLVAVATRFWKWAHKDTNENSETLKVIDGYLASDKRRIEALERHQTVQDEQSKLMLNALWAILEHEIDGNHTVQLVDTRNKIKDYLIDEKNKSKEVMI